MSSMPNVPARLPVGCSWSSRYSKNQTAIFTPLTSVNRPHHQARGFDQAKELDRTGHSKLMDRFPHVTELTFDCSNTVTLAASHDKNVRAALWGEQEDERAVLIS